MTTNENQIVVYQPNETVRLDVRLENDTVWLTQAQLCELFGVVKSNVSYHLKNIFGTNELDYGATVQKIRTVRREAGRSVSRDIEYFNLDVIISLGYRINSKLGIQFRQWATRVLKEYLFHGYAVNVRLNQLEDKMDRRFAKHESDIAELKDKVDFFVQTRTPPLQGVFYDGQIWDARALMLKLIAGAKKSLILIDNWATPEVLDLFAKKRAGVKVTIFTSEHFDRKYVPHRKISEADVKVFNTQYPKLAVRYTESFHDRFLVVDDRELYLVGASLKDLGRKCFAFTKLDTGEIRRIKKTAFA
ncbi:MAG: virulence RhuM family protein [Kiritimatiellae bacterium]|nr:virulence RhuM family protein [Kiritimatiellia bacterium]